MHYTVDHVDNTAIITLHEDHLDATNSAEFKGELLVLCNSGIDVLFINLSEINFCDSTGLSALLFAHREMKTKGGYSILVELSSRLEKLLELAQLDRVLFTYPSITEALKDLQAIEEDDEDEF